MRNLSRRNLLATLGITGVLLLAAGLPIRGGIDYCTAGGYYLSVGGSERLSLSGRFSWPTGPAIEPVSTSADGREDDSPTVEAWHVAGLDVRSEKLPPDRAVVRLLATRASPWTARLALYDRPHRALHIEMDAWLAAAAIALLGMRWRRPSHSPEPDGPWCCSNCGYDLRATPHQCPECGAMAADQQGEPNQRGDRRGPANQRGQEPNP